MSPRTILYVNTTAELGGTDTDLFATVRALDRSRFTPIVALPHRGPFDDAYAALHVEVIHLSLPVVKRGTHLGRLLAAFAPSIQSIYRLIQHRSVDLVYTNSLLLHSAGLAARLARRPALWHSGEFLDRPRILGPTLYSLTAAMATRIIVSSEAVRARFPGWARSKVEVLHNGIDLERFSPEARSSHIRQGLQIPEDAPLVGFVGRFVPWKGVDHFVRVAAAVRAAVPNAHFLIVGSVLEGYTTYAAEVRTLIDELGLSSCTHVLHNRLDVSDIMASLDVFVHCSIRPEPFGIVIVEAMASAKPVIAVNAGGVPEIISRPELGVLVPPGDITASAHAVIDLLQNQARAQALGRAARLHVEQHFEISAVTRRAERIYEQVLAGKEGTAA